MSLHRLWVVLLGTFAAGFTAKEILAFISRKIHVWVERRIDDKVIAYLIREYESYPRTPPNSYGHPQEPYWRSSYQIAESIKRTSVSIFQRLERMEREGRVKKMAPKNDNWTVTGNEFRDYMRRRKRHATQGIP